MNNIINTLKEHWAAFITPILLSLVSLNQIYLYNVDHLNRWKGGGFGMFSTIQERYIHIHLIKKNALECAEPHNDFRKKFSKVTNYPNYLALELLAKKLSTNLWVYNFDPDNPKKPTSVRMIGKKETLNAHDQLAAFDSVELQVFDISFNKSTFTVKPKLLRKIKYVKQ